MPFADGTFDLAICGYSIHHVLHPARVTAELARIVRSPSVRTGGRVALADMVSRDGADRELQTRIEKTRDASHTLALFAEEFRELLEQANMRVISSELAEKTRNFEVWMNAMVGVMVFPGESLSRAGRGRRNLRRRFGRL